MKSSSRQRHSKTSGISISSSPRGGDDRALGYIERIEAYCRGFADSPERGVRRDDLLPGLRIVGFERRIAIAFHLSTDTVTFDRILYGGRDLGSLFHVAEEAGRPPYSK